MPTRAHGATDSLNALLTMQATMRRCAATSRARGAARCGAVGQAEPSGSIGSKTNLFSAVSVTEAATASSTVDVTAVNHVSIM